MSDTFKPLLAKLADGQTFSEDDAEVFFSACLRGEPTPAQIGAAVTAMRLRGETVGEIAACARAMRRAAVMLDHPYDVIDVCGTGGDGLHTLNISTAVGFVAAGGGLKVAKHGNRDVTSKSGTADVLTALGVNIDASREQLRLADHPVQRARPQPFSERRRRLLEFRVLRAGNDRASIKLRAYDETITERFDADAHASREFGTRLCVDES